MENNAKRTKMKLLKLKEVYSLPLILFEMHLCNPHA